MVDNLNLLEERIDELIAEVSRLRKEKVELENLLSEREFLKKKIKELIAKIDEMNE